MYNEKSDYRIFKEQKSKKNLENITFDLYSKTRIWDLKQCNSFDYSPLKKDFIIGIFKIWNDMPKWIFWTQEDRFPNS